METIALDELYAFLDEYMRFYGEFLMLESDKYQIISKNKFQLLDDFIKKEQIFLLKSRGMEKKKDYYLENFGGKDLTLKQIISGINQQEYKNKFNLLYNQLSDILFDLKEANRLCNFLIELHLHKIENHIKKPQRQSQTDQIDHSQQNKTPTGISKKV